MLQLPSPITVCVTYVPLSSTAVYYSMIVYSTFSYIDLDHVSDKIIILGDCNLPGIDWDILMDHSPVSNQFCDLDFSASS